MKYFGTALCIWVLSLPLSAQIGSCTCTCKQGTQTCFPSFSDFCNASMCAQSACGSVEAVKSAIWRPGGCPVQTHPGNYASLVTHVKHSISHQGARVWSGPNSSQLLAGEQLRAAVYAPEANDPAHYPDQAQAQREIREASIPDLQNATGDAIRSCVTETPDTFQHFEWVAKHERRWKDIEGAIGRGDFDGVRSIFSNTEAHDDRIRNTLYCYSGIEIKGLFERLGPFKPDYGPPQPRERHQTDHPK